MPAASAVSGSSWTSVTRMPVCTVHQGRWRPVPPGASSTKPYFASWRRWNEQFDGLSPTRSAACVAVSVPASLSASIRARRTGWAIARIALGSVSSRGLSKAVLGKLVFERCFVNLHENEQVQGDDRRVGVVGEHAVD